MEKQLKCVLLLPLKEMALRKVAVLLWSGSDLLASISKYPFIYSGLSDDIRKEWPEDLEPKIKDEVSKLGLPESLAKKAIDLVRPIGLEIRIWKHLHERRYLSEEVGLPGSTKLCWTTVGRIDDRRTAKELVRCEEMSAVKRYELACNYCLEDCIPLLWEGLPEEEKDCYYNLKTFYALDLQYRWPHILKGEQSNLDYLWISKERNLTSFNQWAFEQSVKYGYKSAVEHFFQKLTHEEREASLMRSAHALLARTDFSFSDNRGTCDVMYYLLSLMTPEQQMESFKAHPISILLSFLRWPMQDLFLENLSLILTFIPPSDYCCLLWCVFRIFRESELYSPKFFQEFFIQSLKKDFGGRDNASKFLRIFIHFKDSESIEVLFRNVDAADRVELVCHPDTLVRFHEEILSERWHMVEVYLREAMLSGVDRKTLEKAFLRHCRLNWEDPVFKRLLKFLDDTYPSSDRETKARKR